MPRYTFTTLDDASSAFAINDLGQIVGKDGAGGFLYDHDTFTRISDPNAISPWATVPQGINNSGEIVGFFYNDGNHGFVYTGGNYTTIDVGPNTQINGVNDLGQFVGSYDGETGGAHGFVYSDGVYTHLDVPGAHFTVPTGINDRGEIVGHFNLPNSNPAHGFLYSEGVYTEINDPLAVYGSNPIGINDAGDIVGVYTDSTFTAHGFLYSHGVYTTVDDPLGTLTTNNGINNRGQIVGYYNPPGEGGHAFIATPNGRGDAHVSDANLESFVFKPDPTPAIAADLNQNSHIMPAQLFSQAHTEIAAPVVHLEENAISSGMHFTEVQVHLGGDFHLI